MADENTQLLEEGKQMTDLVLAFSILILWHSRDLTRRNKWSPRVQESLKLGLLILRMLVRNKAENR